MKTLSLTLTLSLWPALVLLGPACSSPDTSARVDPATAVSGPDFLPVAQVLVDRCGSIDCHGSKYRNMRLYGYASERLDPTHRPDAPETTQVEADRNYEALVAVEPDLMRQVIAEGGARSERLTLVRKAHGTEHHKGGHRIIIGDIADTCLQSWLASKVNAAACKAAVPRLNEP